MTDTFPDGSPPPAIEARGLCWTYAGRSERSLDGLDFRLEPGRVLLVLGPSGSGKSTLARAIAGLIPHVLPGEWRGNLRVGDFEVERTPARFLGEKVGLVFQDPDSQLVMSRTDDEVAFGLENHGWPHEAMTLRVPEVLAQVGLAGFESRRTMTLSGGEKQRLAIAGVLANRPGLLVLDEPTANLDPPGMHAIFETLSDLAARHDHTIVLIEHRLEAALPLADDVLLIDDRGRQVDFAPAGQVNAASIDRLERAGAWLPKAWQTGRLGDGRSNGHGDSTAAPAPGPRSRTALEVRDLRIEYPADASGRHPALDGISMVATAGERIGLVGPNGAGKSSLLLAIAGLLRPQSGAVRVGVPGPDESVEMRNPARLSSREISRSIGLAFQDPELGFVARTARDEVLASGGAAAVGSADSVLEHFGLGRVAAFDSFRLSQGEQRRLSLAALALRPPAVLLLDEPTFGLDRRGTEAVIALLDRTRTNGQAQVLATHDPRLLPACDRVVALDRGRIVFDGPPFEFLENPPYRPAEPWREGVAVGRSPAEPFVRSGGRA